MRGRWAAFAAVCLFLASAAAAQQSAVHSVWQGAGSQDTGTSWTILITFYNDGRADIAYPSAKCGGRLDFLGYASDGISPSYREVLTFGTGVCVDQGTVILVQQSPQTFGYFWFYPDRPQAPGGSGSVVRIR